MARDLTPGTGPRRGRLPSLGRRHSRRRTVLGFASGLIVPLLLTAVLSPFGADLNLTTDALIFQLGVVAVALLGGASSALLGGASSALLGGASSALLASLVASVLLNYFFIPPVHTL
ncbi:DUF4118 domain-containing protein, partial [Kitasatospora sp. NPDC047058]|uniref:DUF4118 domain-containing protein n=1 Tax=Kitasatospora sp. NPDC047058 TaxID=3155620 RepID=UPI0033ED6C83